MIIREATKEDIPRIIVLGKEFAVASQKAHEMSISDEKIAGFANTVVENKFWTVLVMGVENVIEKKVGDKTYLNIETPKAGNAGNPQVVELLTKISSQLGIIVEKIETTLKTPVIDAGYHYPTPEEEGITVEVEVVAVAIALCPVPKG